MFGARTNAIAPAREWMVAAALPSYPNQASSRLQGPHHTADLLRGDQ